MAIWQYLILAVSVLAGGGVAQYLSSYGAGAEDPRWKASLPLLLSFSGAYLLSIAAMELMPTVFHDPSLHSGGWLLGGFLLQLILESLSQGVEHGHVHAHDHAPPSYALSIMLGLGLHAFLEGLPLGTIAQTAGGLHDHAHAHVHASGDHLLWGIVLHKIPAAFALSLLLRTSNFTPVFTWLCLLIFAALTPLGALVGAEISFNPVWTNRVLALVVGSFLHIGTTIIFEADGGRAHGISAKKLVVVIVGVLVAFFTAH